MRAGRERRRAAALFFFALQTKEAAMDANYETTKSYAQRVHAKRRFHERKGIDLTRKLRRQLVAMIRDEDRSVRLVTRQSRRVSVVGCAGVGRALPRRLRLHEEEYRDRPARCAELSTL